MNQYSAFHLQYLPKGTQVYIQGCAHEWHLDGARCKTLLSLCLPPSWFHRNGSPKTPVSLNGCFNIQKLCCCSFFASSCRWQLSCYLRPLKKKTTTSMHCQTTLKMENQITYEMCEWTMRRFPGVSIIQSCIHKQKKSLMTTLSDPARG